MRNDSGRCQEREPDTDRTKDKFAKRERYGKLTGREREREGQRQRDRDKEEKQRQTGERKR